MIYWVVFCDAKGLRLYMEVAKTRTLFLEKKIKNEYI